MSYPYASQPLSTAGEPVAENRPRKSGGIVALLAVLTVLNLIVLGIAARTGWPTRWTTATRSFAGMMTFSLVVSLIGLIGLGGAWATRKWGPRVYLGAILLDRIVALIVMPEFFPPVAIVGILLAVFLVRAAERDW